jgi:hypothetical protein
MAVVVPPQAYFQVQQQMGYAGSYRDFLWLYFSGFHGFCQAGHCLRLPTWNHLWFLPYLAVYTGLLVAAWHWLPRATLSRWADLAARLSGWRLIVWPWLLVGAERALLLPRFATPMHSWTTGSTTPPSGRCSPGVCWMARRPVLLAHLEALRWPALAIAAGAWAGLVTYSAQVAGWAEVPEILRLPMRFVFAAEARNGWARREGATLGSRVETNSSVAPFWGLEANPAVDRSRASSV